MHEVFGRVVAMVRVSSDDQDVQSQRDVIQRWADQHGIVIARWYEEEGRPRRRAMFSAKFEGMIRDGENGAYDWLIVDHKKRLGTRNSEEYGYYATRLTRSNVRIWSVDKGELTKRDLSTAITNVVDDVTSTEELTDRARNVNRGKYLNAIKSQYNGGPLPLGYDRVCYSKDGEELYRVVDLARDHRVVVFPNGDRQERKGKGNRPGKGKFDKYYYAISEVAERVDTVREIFRRFADEAVSADGIARDLTNRRVPRVYGEIWHQKVVTDILTNPIYVGKPTWAKTTQAAYKRIAPDGASYIDPVWKGNREGYVHNPQDEWVAGEEQPHLRLIDQETWDAVQEKIARVPSRRNSPRSDKLWLKHFLVCATCGLPMRGWSPVSRPKERSYHCARYADYRGADNPTRCGKNRVMAEVIEEKLAEFLDKVGSDVKTVVRGKGERIGKLLLELGDRESVLFAVLIQMKKYVEQFLPSDQLDLLGMEGGIAIDEAYRHYYAAETEGARREIDAERVTLRSLTRSRAGLAEGGEADRMILDDIRDCENRIEVLKARLVPLDERLDAIYADLTRLDEAVVSAQEALAGSSNRQKADALRKVLNRIVVHFRDNPQTGGKKRRSLLTRLVFEPVQGPEITFDFD